MEDQILQAQRMEAVGHRATGVAHDFNNLLGVILGYCEILEHQGELAQGPRNMVAEIHRAGASAKQLTEGLLAFCRGSALRPATLDLNRVVNQMEPLLARMMGDGIRLRTALADDLGTIEADSGQLEQVLMNLAINASDAMPRGGEVSIRTANLDVVAGIDIQDVDEKAGRYVTLTVTDEGVGMDEPTQAHMFEPFFSTKLRARGTGIGLSTVHSIVGQSRGVIRVDSLPGRGTSFDIRFPRSDAAPLVEEPRTPLRGGSETILLVDDAVALRLLTRRILEDCGYTVLDAGDPVLALRMAQEHPGPVHLLITDLTMPGLSGFDLADKLAVMRPRIPVLYASGSGAGWSTSREDCALLNKPFTREELLNTVRVLLDRSLAAARQPSLPFGSPAPRVTNSKAAIGGITFPGQPRSA